MSSCGSKYYRRRPGIGWLLALITVPLLLALIASCASDTVTAPAAPPPVATPSAEAGGQFGAMSIVRTGKGFNLTGELPDDALKTELADTIRQAMPGANIVDNLTVKPGVKAPEIAGLGALFGAALDVTGFSANLAGGRVTLTGTARNSEAKAAAETAAKATWPNVAVVNDIQVSAAGASPTAPAPAGTCATLQADVAGLLKTPITFATDGFTLAQDSAHVVAQIADKVKACQGVKLAVVGYTDNTGGDAINIPLSTNRAKAVADALVSDGLAKESVTSRGAGAANPVAANDTPSGRAQNRRVEIAFG